MNEQKADPLLRPITGNGFSFRCHKEIACFNRCCADLNLILTPYDIIRIKNRLGLSSVTFLDKYTEARLDDRNRFPMVYLKMANEEGKKCPFVTADGCTIYEDRPGACRLYPLARAATKSDGHKDTLEHFFIVGEEHCLGFTEECHWTIEGWMENQGVDEYNPMNDIWLEIITFPKGFGDEGDPSQKIKMFSMASYNLDRFREFLFKSSFFDRFNVECDLMERMSSDDVVLMRFAFDWLKFSLFGESNMEIKSASAPL